MGRIRKRPKTLSFMLKKKALVRMKNLENLLVKFRAKSKKVLGWSGEKEEFLGENLQQDIDIQNLRAKINSFWRF